VSRVINDSPNVSEKTRKRVLSSIEQLDYKPNEAARQLATGRSHTIGIISFGNAYYGPWQVLTSIEQSLKQKGYSLTISFIDYTDPNALRDCFGQLEPKQLEGLVLITPMTNLVLEDLRLCLKHIPYVMIDIDKGIDFPSVLIDQHYGMNLAIDHLLKLGHRQIASISGPLNWAVAASRQQGLIKALDKAGLQLCLYAEGDWSVKSGYEATLNLLNQNQTFSALVAANDHMALGAYRALKEAGLKIPQDVSVIGFDDIPEADFLDPSLTTIRQDFAMLGQQSVDYLLSLIKEAGPSYQRVLFPSLVLRSSTAAVRLA
jgi:DNA-binding LacI/PurR family transcriptional regulator